MKKIIILAALFAICGQAFAQKTFSIKKNSGKIILNNINAYQIEGYNGNEILITLEQEKEEKPNPRADGLKALSADGFDNTGLGLIVKENGNVTELISANTNMEGILFIKVPAEVQISINNQGKFSNNSFSFTFSADGESTNMVNTGKTDKRNSILLKNIKSEITANVHYSDLILENITGPLSITATYGNIQANLAEPVKGPFSLASIYGFIDLTLPEKLKANINVSTGYGTLYASEELPLKAVYTEDVDSSNNTRHKRITNTIKRTLNGGGEDIILKSSYGEIYLRKK